MTDHNLLAALSCKTGAVVWRQAATPGTEFLTVRVCGERLITLGNDGSVQGWSALSGLPIWTVQEDALTASSNLFVSADADHVYVADQGTIYAIEALQGTLQWHNVYLEEGALLLGVVATESAIFLACDSNTDGITSLKLDSRTGSVESSHSIGHATSMPQRSQSNERTDSCPLMIYQDSKHHKLVLKHLIDGTETLIEVGHDFTHFSTHMTCDDKGIVLLVEFKHPSKVWAQVYNVDHSGLVRETYPIIDDLGSARYALVEHESATYVVQLMGIDENGLIQIRKSTKQDIVGSSSISTTGFSLSSISTFSAELLTSSGSVHSRVLVATTDGDVSMWQKDMPDWTRAEGLSRTTKVLLVQLAKLDPSVLESSRQTSPFGNLFKRFRRHIESILALARRPRADEGVVDGSVHKGDHFGLRQAVIACSQTTIWAIDTLAPENVMWTAFLSQQEYILLDAKLHVDKITKLSSVVLTAKKRGHEVILVLDPLTGAFQEDDDPSKSDSELVPAALDLWIEMESRAATAHEGENPNVLWQFEAPSGHRFVAKALTSSNLVASIGRVLGDRGVLYKYLTPVVAFLTINDLSQSLSVFVLSIEDGRIIYQATHHNIATGKPVHIVVSENWMAYHFWAGGDVNAYQMVITELYQGERNVKSEDRMAGAHHLSKTFIYDHEISAMAVTTSKQGITSRDLVVALASGEITTVSRRLLDPRRPHPENVGAEDKEEGLIPYEAILPLEPKAVLSHTRTVLGVKGIVTGPTLLESTGLICAYGLDLFITRVTPSMPFDTLSDSFSKAQIVISLSTLCIGIFITRPMAARKSLARRWIG